MIYSPQVPVITIFTKFDSFDAQTFRLLCEAGMLRKEAKARALDCAIRRFNREHLPRILKKKFPPADTLYLRGDVCFRLWCLGFVLTISPLDMHKIEQKKDIQTAMWDLIMKTVDALKSDTAKQLLVSVQQINVELCIKYAVERQVNCCHSLRVVIIFIFRGPIFERIQCMTPQTINCNCKVFIMESFTYGSCTTTWGNKCF